MICHNFDLKSERGKHFPVNFSESKGKDYADKRYIKNGLYGSNEHVSHIYKNYAQYMKQNPVLYNRHKESKSKDAGSVYIKHLEKYYDYYNVYKPKKNLLEPNRNVVPNRKLSPMKKNIINIR